MKRLALLLAATLAASVAGPASPGHGRPARAAITKPNIVLILSDDQTIDGLARGLPYLNAGPGGSWVRFPNTTINTPLCCPSRATILSGQYSTHTGVQRNGQGSRFRDSATMATWLHGAGYHTALIGKYLNLYGVSFGLHNYIPPGWDDWQAFSSRVNYYNYTLNDNGRTVSYGRSEADYSTDVLSAKATVFVRTATQPFYLHFTPFAPHVPLQAARRYKDDTRFNGLDLSTPNFNERDVSDKPAWVRTKPLLSSAQASSQLNRHKGSLLNLLALNDGIANIYQALAARGILNNTVIVFMTDNGYLYGEHRLAQGKTCPYTECVGTQMLVRYPGAVSHTDTRVLSNADLASTFTELAGTRPTIPQDGRSFVSLLTNPAAPWTRDGPLIDWPGGGTQGAPKYSGIRTPGWKYVEYATREKELYDEVHDPYELTNHANDPAYAAVQSDLAAKLHAAEH